MERQRQYETVYEQIYPALDIFENTRQRAAQKTKNLRIILATLFGVLALVVAFFFLAKEPGILAFLIPIGLLAFFGSGFYKRQYFKKYKSDLTQIVFGNLGIQTKMKPFNHVKGADFRNSKLFKRTNSYSGEDLIVGEKNAVLFKCSELEANYEVKDSDGDIVIQDEIFKGLFFTADIPHDTETSIIIHTKDFQYSYSKSIPSGDFDTLNEAFDHLFHLSYSDYDRTSHILSPKFMQCLIDFKYKHAHPFVLKISGSKVYLAINEEVNFFELDFKRSAKDKEVVYTIWQDCEFFADIIDFLEEVN